MAVAQYILIFGLLFIIMLIIFSVYLVDKISFEGKIRKININNIQINGNEIIFDSLTLKQKIGQMIIIRGNDKKNIELMRLNIGGIFLSKQDSEADYRNLIKKYKENSKIELFVSSDLEGAWNPFSKFRDFPSFEDIKNKSEAYEIGLEHGEILKELGFNMNFAPVAEFFDESYGGRVFSGSKEEIKEKLENYIKGLQKNVAGTCKHYPGKGMIGNLHLRKDKQEVTLDDLELFETCFKNNISNVMIGHQIVSGEINSKRKPASVSREVIESLKEKGFNGLIISDEVNMLGLRSFYLKKENMYKELINSGENLILDFELNARSAYALMNEIEKMIRNKEIDEEKINLSVKKILKAKGYVIG